MQKSHVVKISEYFLKLYILFMFIFANFCYHCDIFVETFDFVLRFGYNMYICRMNCIIQFHPSIQWNVVGMKSNKKARMPADACIYLHFPFRFCNFKFETYPVANLCHSEIDWTIILSHCMNKCGKKPWKLYLLNIC